jgi:hypothetical protein
VQVNDLRSLLSIKVAAHRVSHLLLEGGQIICFGEDICPDALGQETAPGHGYDNEVDLDHECLPNWYVDG